MCREHGTIVEQMQNSSKACDATLLGKYRYVHKSKGGKAKMNPEVWDQSQGHQYVHRVGCRYASKISMKNNSVS